MREKERVFGDGFDSVGYGQFGKAMYDLGLFSCYDSNSRACFVPFNMNAQSDISLS